MSSSPGPDTRLIPAAGVITERIGEQVVMLDPERDLYLRLNQTGSFLWTAIEGDDRPTVAELAGRLAAETGIGPERALADATAFAADLLEREIATGSRP